MASIFDDIGKIGLDGKQITFLDAMQGRGLPHYSSNPFNVPTPTGINYNDLTQQLSNQPINRAGLISNANAGLSMPVMQTNTQIPTQQPTSSNIFGDVLGTVFPGIDQSNKQLINAAILQGSLELLKPRQAGENLASQFGRAITAGQKVGTDLEKQALEKLVTQFGLQKTAAEIQELQKTKPGKQVSITKEKRELFEKVIDTVYDTDPSFKTTVDLIKEKVGTDISSNLGDEQRRAIELEAMSINASTGLGAVESTKIAAQNFLTGQKSIPTVSGEDRFAGRTIKEKK